MRNQHHEHLADISHLVLFPHHQQPKQKQQQSMTHVTEHDTEQEWEGYCGKQGWVGFAISSNAVCLDDILCRSSV